MAHPKLCAKTTKKKGAGKTQRLFLNRQKPLRSTDAVTLRALAFHLAGATHSRSLFTGALFRWLFIMAAQLHFAIDAFALQLLLQSPKRLVYIIVANDNLHKKATLRNQKCTALWACRERFSAATADCGTSREKRPYVPIPEKARKKPKVDGIRLLLSRRRSLRRLHRGRLQMQHQALICLSGHILSALAV